jgi:hypothetical protein
MQTTLDLIYNGHTVDKSKPLGKDVFSQVIARLLSGNK